MLAADKLPTKIPEQSHMNIQLNISVVPDLDLLSRNTELSPFFYKKKLNLSVSPSAGTSVSFSDQAV